MDRYTQKQISEYCRESYSYAEVIKRMGLPISGNNYRKLKNRIQKYGVDISHFTGRRWSKSPNIQSAVARTGSREKWALDEILCPNSPITQKVLRGYVRRYNIIPYRCFKCNNNGLWQEELLSLELDHIDGDDHNNTPSNLRYLCPNCHSQTSTYRGRNKSLKNKKNCKS